MRQLISKQGLRRDHVKENDVPYMERTRDFYRAQGYTSGLSVGTL